MLHYRLYHEKTCSQELNQLDHRIDKAWYSLQNLIELEEKLATLESRYDLPEKETEVSSTSSIKTQGDEFKQATADCLNSRPTLELKNLQISQIREM